MNFPSTLSFASVMDKASSATRTGIVSGAKLLAQGIDKTGEIIKNHSSEEEKSLKHVAHIQKASETTTKIVGTSHKLLGKAVHKTMEVASDAWYSMPESELMKKISENQHFQVGLEVGKIGAAAGMNIIGGVGEGFNIVKDSAVNSTVGVVEHRYGQDAGKITKETFKIAGNLFGVYQLTYMTGFIGVSATEVMKIQEEQVKVQIILDCITKDMI
jgi:hypothetical protein